MWKPGESGNKLGRPIGTRNKFSENFVSDVAATWAKHGESILEKMVTDEPTRFAELCGRLIPRDVQLTVSQRVPGGLEAEDWAIALEVFQAVRAGLPEADKRSPGEVLNFVLDAIRSHQAIVVDLNQKQPEQTTIRSHDAKLIECDMTPG